MTLIDTQRVFKEKRNECIQPHMNKSDDWKKKKTLTK